MQGYQPVQPGQPGMVMMAPQPAVYQTAAPTVQAANAGRVYKEKQAYVLGVLQIVIGVLCFLAQVSAVWVGTQMHSVTSVMSTGIWCGVLFMIAGICGIQSAKGKGNSWIIACMIMSIVSAIFTLGIITNSGVGMGFDNEEADQMEYAKYGDHQRYYTYESPRNRDTRTAMNIILILLGFAEIVISIWASALCCHVACCGRSVVPMVMYQAGTIPAGQMMPQGQGQPMMMQGQGQPMMMQSPQGQGQPMMMQSNMMYTMPQGQFAMPQGQFAGQNAYVLQGNMLVPLAMPQQPQVSFVPSAQPAQQQQELQRQDSSPPPYTSEGETSSPEQKDEQP